MIWAWGVAGVALILVEPIRRLSVHAGDALATGLSPMQWAVALPWCVFMIYSEGYQGFHLMFSPRVVVRSLNIAAEPRPHLVLLAPFVAMGLLHATPRRKRVAWGLVAMITTLVLVMRWLPPVWRGIIDMGVVLGLSIGLCSLLGYAVRTLAGTPPDIDPDWPEQTAEGPVAG